VVEPTWTTGGEDAMLPLGEAGGWFMNMLCRRRCCCSGMKKIDNFSPLSMDKRGCSGAFGSARHSTHEIW
jgi:hypothetical protein